MKLRKNDQLISDVMDGTAYIFEDYTFNLVLFADSVVYNKSRNKSMWALFSSIVELPPLLRNCSENIIFHSSWSGPLPEFNLYLKEYNKTLDYIIQNGIEVEGKLYKLKIHICIADAPARAKLCNSIQFNGKYGCLKCLHPTAHEGHTIYPSLTKLRELQLQKEEIQTISIEPRTREVYLKQIKIIDSREFEEFFQGIRGNTHLGNWLKGNSSLPNGMYLDKMHLCDIGTFKYMFNAFFEYKNRHSEFYLGDYT
jgi:hypothetical protein